MIEMVDWKNERLLAPKTLSVLIPSLKSRLPELAAMYQHIEDQVGNRTDVEVLSLVDAKTMSLGHKRNQLMAMARGKYLTFVNDDDEIAPRWLDTIMSNLAAEPDVDVLSIRASCNSRISAFSPWVHSHFMATSLKCSDAGVMYTKEPKIFLHKPVMWCVWKSDIARSARFPDLTYGEDNPWALEACKHAKTERIVPQAIYCYNSDDANSEAGPWRTDSNCGMKIDFVSNEREFVSKHRELLAELKLMGAAA